MAKRLGLSAVLETSAKNNEGIDDVFFRSVTNCVDMNEDLNATSAEDSILSGRRAGALSHKQSTGRFSARGSDKRYFYFNPEDDYSNDYERELRN